MSLHSSAQIGEIIRNAVVFNVKNWRGGSLNSDSLIQTVQDLFSILEERQVKYVLAGGIAVLYYVEGRNTQDLDLIMALSSLKKMPVLEISVRDIYIVEANYGELHLDILLTKNPLFSKIFRKYSKIERFLDRNIPIATVEGILLLKLYALPSLYRQGNFAKVSIHENDIATLIYYYQPDMGSLLRELSKYISNSDLGEISGIVTEIQNRISRFKK